MDKQKCVEVCNSLLRGELSAIETYETALKKFSSEPEAAKLRDILSEHSKSAETLKQIVVEMGASPSTDSGAWGTFANAVQKSAQLFGENSALSSLKQGEQHGLKEYKEALKNDNVLQKSKQVITDELLPRQNKHIAELEQLKAKH